MSHKQTKYYKQNARDVSKCSQVDPSYIQSKFMDIERQVEPKDKCPWPIPYYNKYFHSLYFQVIFQIILSLLGL